MWRSYYDKQRLQLFAQLAELLRKQYNLPIIRSNLVAYYAANAAVVFQRGRERSDYEKALPDLLKFYHSIRRMSDLLFEPNKAPLFHFNLTGNRRKIGVDDPRLEDRIADNLTFHDMTESESLLLVECLSLPLCCY